MFSALRNKIKKNHINQNNCEHEPITKSNSVEKAKKCIINKMNYR